MSDRVRRLAELCHYRWTVPCLAALVAGGGAKFVTLTHRLGASPSAVRRSLDFLVEHEFVRRNPGYGHPLRPEYVLTSRGKRVGEACRALDRALDRHDLRGVCLQKWSLAALVAIADGDLRFNDVRRALPGATARAVTMTLKSLTEDGLVQRTVSDDYRPTVTYALAGRGRQAAALAGAVADAA